MLSILRQALFDVRRVWPTAISYVILLRLFEAVVAAPLASLLLALLLKTSGRTALGNEQIARFLLSPVGIVGLVLIAALWLATRFLELAGLVFLAAGSLRQGRPSGAIVLWRAVRTAPRLLQLAAIQAAAFLATLVPFALFAWFTYRGLLSEADINYYLANWPGEFQLAVAIGVLGAIILALVWAVLYIRWSLSVPLLALRSCSAREAMRTSVRLVRGRWRLVAQVLLGWMLLAAVGSVMVALLLALLNRAVLALVGDSIPVVLVAMVGLLAFDLLVATAVAIVAFVPQGFLMVRLLQRLEVEHGAKSDVEAKGETPLAKDPPVRIRRLLWIGAIVALLAAMVGSYQFVNRPQRPTLATAHRGDSGRAPENTLASIRAAIESGADFAEIDVQETADGVIVVLHDSDLRRITGLAKSIWEVDYDEIRDLDAGSWFAPEFRDERIPTLEQAIDTAGDRIRLNIELKYNGHDQQLAQRVARIIDRQQFTDRCVISSLDYDGLGQVRGLDPRLKVGYIVFESVGALESLDLDFFSLNSKLATVEQVAAIHAEGKQVHVWTVNDRNAMETFLDRGVDNIITDRPTALVEMIDERRQRSTIEQLLLTLRRRLVP